MTRGNMVKKGKREGGRTRNKGGGEKGKKGKRGRKGRKRMVSKNMA